MAGANGAIRSVTFLEEEEAGGREEFICFPDGLIRSEGHATGGGYAPRLADGWYRAKSHDAVRRLFAWAETVHATGLDSTTLPIETFSSRIGCRSTITIDTEDGPVEAGHTSIGLQCPDPLELLVAAGLSDGSDPDIQFVPDPQDLPAPIATLELPPTSGPPV